MSTWVTPKLEDMEIDEAGDSVNIYNVASDSMGAIHVSLDIEIFYKVINRMPRLYETKENKREDR